MAGCRGSCTDTSRYQSVMSVVVVSCKLTTFFVDVVLVLAVLIVNDVVEVDWSLYGNCIYVLNSGRHIHIDSPAEVELISNYPQSNSAYSLYAPLD